MFEEGADLLAQGTLGHERLSTTQRCTQPTTNRCWKFTKDPSDGALSAFY